MTEKKIKDMTKEELDAYWDKVIEQENKIKSFIEMMDRELNEVSLRVDGEREVNVMWENHIVVAVQDATKYNSFSMRDLKNLEKYLEGINIRNFKGKLTVLGRPKFDLVGVN